MGTVHEAAVDSFAPTTTAKAFADSAYQDSILYIPDDFQSALQAIPLYFQEYSFTSPDSGVDGPFQHAYNCRRFASMMDVWSNRRPRWFSEDDYPVKERLIADADRDFPFLIDIGGGSGHDVEGLRQAFIGQLPGILMLKDWLEVIDIARVGSSADGMVHDFLTERPVKGARAYYLHSMIQDWNDEVNTQILKAIVLAMRRDYFRILINDFVVPDQDAHWAQTCLDWELMARLGARYRTEAEHRALYKGTGLKITGLWRHPQCLDALNEL